MTVEAATALSGNYFRGRTKWLVTKCRQCFVEDGQGQLLCHCRADDTTYRSPAILTTRTDHTQGLLKIQRPPGNLEQELIHEGIPVTDNLFIVTDLTSNVHIGVVQKPWPRGIWRDLWIVRDSGWAEICRIEQFSLLRSLLSNSVITSLPRRYRILAQAQPIGTLCSSWSIARLKVSVDLRQDVHRRFDRRLAVAFLVLLLTQ